MSNLEEFRKLYIKLEDLTLDKYFNGEDVSFSQALRTLKKEHIYPYFNEYEFINFCREYRNVISHQYLENKYLDFTDETIEKLQKIVSIIENPTKAIELSSRDIIYANINDSVVEKIALMNTRAIGYLPIYDDTGLCGVFSEKVLLKYLSINKNLTIDDSMTFNDIRAFIDIKNTEDFIYFVSQEILYKEVVKIFTDEYKKGRKLTIFITKNGLNNERVLGILTAFDIINKS